MRIRRTCLAQFRGVRDELTGWRPHFTTERIHPNKVAENPHRAPPLVDKSQFLGYCLTVVIQGYITTTWKNTGEGDHPC